MPKVQSVVRVMGRGVKYCY